MPRCGDVTRMPRGCLVAGCRADASLRGCRADASLRGCHADAARMPRCGDAARMSRGCLTDFAPITGLVDVGCLATASVAYSARAV